MKKIILTLLGLELLRRAFEHFTLKWVSKRVDSFERDLDAYRKEYWRLHYQSLFGTPENWARTKGRIVASSRKN